MAALFGIHVGNSSACVALSKDEERVDIIANDAGERVTPTVVQWTQSSCIVGRAALQEQFKHPNCTISRNKQLLNDGISDAELDNLRNHVPYKIIKTDSSVKYELLFDGRQVNVFPREIAEVIFKKIHAIAESAVGGNKELNAVICVPLYFSNKSIALIKSLTAKAGFNVLQVIDEPCAAALACGLGTNPDDPPCYCLVYRAGGVSLDATVLLVQGGMFSVLGSVHKYNLGGALLSEKIADFLASEFKRQYRNTEISERGKWKLFAAAENVKQILSIQNTAQCSVESIGSGYDLNCSVSRARFENLMSSQLPEMVATVTEVLAQSGLSVEKINKVVICGGSLKIPKLQEAIRNLLPSAEMLGTLNPDELIPLGAAKQACHCDKYDNLPDSLCLDTPCLSSSLNIVVKQDNANEEISFFCPAKSSLPFRMRKIVQTTGKSFLASVVKEDQTPVTLGSTSLDDLETPSEVSIDFDVNKDGKLFLTLANEASSKKNSFKCDLNENATS